VRLMYPELSENG